MKRIAIAVLLYASSFVAFADTLVVDNDFVDCPQAQFNSIQAAVFAAQPGDKILVCPGVYAESVQINKADLRIEAQAAPGEVVLQGPGAAALTVGFDLRDVTGVLLQGFTVQAFHTNIRIQDGSGNTLRKNISTAAGQVGILVFNSADNVVEQNISSLTTALAPALASEGILVRESGSTRNIIRHNETFQNLRGIGLVRTGTGNVVLGNRSYANTLLGIRNFTLSNGNVIENNHVFENLLGGIIIGDSTEVTVRNNRFERNIEFGIRIQNSSTNNLVEKNEVFRNDQDGIRFQNIPVVPGVAPAGTSFNIVRLNHVRENGRDGIRVFDASMVANTIERNVLLHNVEHDAHDDSVPGTNFWINNRCGAEDHPGQNENRPGLCENH